MITILDYGLGNVRAFLNVYKRLDIEARAVSDPAQLRAGERLILPGVGAFDHAMDLLDASGMRDRVEQLVHEEGCPVLGVCVGMQMLADGSDEGRRAGLGWVPGRVRSLGGRNHSAPMPLPHMGWNDVTPVPGVGLFDGMDDLRFYFLHSFYYEPAQAEHVLGTVEYGGDFACAVGNGLVFGVQFHPEKSHHWGSRMLQNFAEQPLC
ncbi:imidazole glycerol phosphate synthase subunit HisH [Brevundimonas sp. Root1423]|uniref:imidazole glycerol phosphate synthase subunit HisH n=1 Tax=Brevundimonas sp. Root1423 TaxID=1736462 RepID=UPI0006F9998B|nr:imidazole glycerol phosphate synthase subunit HisH [Brevundimonas sp. Root1423]KQY84848.1 imidazole glycerol phosphate synthase subunit HisH [Brevundimonas sp. Root1423]